MSLNQVNLTGHLTRDTELKYTPKGTAVCKFSVAVNDVWRNDAGEKMESVTFVDVEAWGRTAEVICEYFKKGSPVLVTGRLKQDIWEDKQTGQKRSKLFVVADSFEFMGGKRETDRPEADAAAAARGQRSSASAPPPRRPSAPPPKQHDPDLDQPEDDIPF